MARQYARGERGWRIREVKRQSRQVLRRNFAVCFLACIILGFVNADPSALSENTNASTQLLESIAEAVPDTPVASVVYDVLEAINGVKATTSLGSDSSAGVISTIYTGVKVAGSMSGAVLDLVNSSVFNDQLSASIIAGAGVALTVLTFFFVSEVFTIGCYRLFLENRLYPKTSLSRLFFIYQIRRLLPTVRIVFFKYVRLLLWGLTIVGFPLKYYSYYLVPLIQAENPDIPSRAVFRLSERMMRKHRFRVFLFDASFIGWTLLSLLTFGIVSYVWLNPYRNAARAELYAALRARALQKGLPGVEYLRDSALFAIPTDLPQTNAGAGVKAATAMTETEATVAAEAGTAMTETGIYPFITHHPLERHIQGRITVETRERYSVLNLVLMFFLFSFVGWIWECAVAFAQSGMFINRGSLYGPWIPIYGFGGVSILVFLNRFNRQPLLCFFATIVLCGIIEYVAATAIWSLYHVKYWDYSGYFFNIQGRICLEGLLAFGILGMVGLYLIAPVTDALLQTIPPIWRQRFCALLLMAFGGDVAAAAFIPHTGEGITTTVGQGDGASVSFHWNEGSSLPKIRGC
ncbi:MAG: DUF975 family protein [Coriobacteriales bacterium]|nr:DUF975 family protein [Coriobacteriales bacterium]